MSGISTAKGLDAQIAEMHGIVYWTWMVDTNTTPGSWRIVAIASYKEEFATSETYWPAPIRYTTC